MIDSQGRLGSSFDSWLEENDLHEEVTSEALKAVLAAQIAEEMKKQHITKTRMAELMRTSRAQVDRLLSTEGCGVTLETLACAAQAVGRTLRIELV